MKRVDSEIMESIKEKLQPLIGSKGGVTDFAKSIGVSRDDVNNWNKGKSDIRLSALIAISKEYGISIDYLLGISPHSSPDISVTGAEIVTGLTREAIESLQEIDGPGMIIASKIIESDSFIDLISAFFEFERKAIQANDLIEEIKKTPCPSLEDLRTLEAYTERLRFGRYIFTEICTDLLKEISPVNIDKVLEESERIAKNSEL